MVSHACRSISLEQPTTNVQDMSPTIPFPSLFWVLFLSWAIHDIEEIVFFDRTPERSPAFFAEVRPTSRRQFGLAVTIVGVFVLFATVAGVSQPFGLGGRIFSVFLGGYFLHGFVHIGYSVRSRSYTPGVVTAVLVVIPSSLFLYSRLFGEGLIRPMSAVGLAVLGVFLFVPIVVGANAVASWISVPRQATR